MQITLFLQLIVAHICVDFILQNNKLIDKKNKYGVRSPHIYLHALLSGLLSLLFINQWGYWYVGLFIAVTHFFIDWWKIHLQKIDLEKFIIEQIAHLIIVIIAWLWIGQGLESVSCKMQEVIKSIPFLITLIAYSLVIFPVGFIIDKATKKWQDEIEFTKDLEEGLDKAGRYIGILERVLVLTFVILNQMSAIGFLIAAKSILRYGDKEKIGARKQTEYVLIGTLMSFAFAIVIGLLVRIVGLQ